jgi:hypothetical protein
MDLHDDVVLDLLTLARNGQASAATRTLVQAELTQRPQLAVFAAMSAPPDAGLELRALERTRDAMRRASWEKAAAIAFSVLPFSFVVDDHGLRFMFADYPGLIVGMVVTALAFWARYWKFRKECTLP